MRRLLLLTVSIVAAMWSAQPRLEAQKQQQLFISHLAPDGTPVTDLTASEVTVSEDGVACKILKVEAVNWPMKVQVLVDNGKANTNPINSLREGLTALFAALPDGVEVSLYTTAPQPRPIVKSTADKAALTKGIGLIAPDSGAGAFFDALSEAASRSEKDKMPHFPVIFMIGSDLGRNNVMDRDYQKLQENIVNKGMTVHVIVNSAGATASGGALQTEVGLAVTKLSGGRYENIATTNRLTTLLPEIGKRIAVSHARQSHQVRVTYERPANPKPMPQIGASVQRPGTPSLSLDGHLP